MVLGVRIMYAVQAGAGLNTCLGNLRSKADELESQNLKRNSSIYWILFYVEQNVLQFQGLLIAREMQVLSFEMLKSDLVSRIN